MRAARGWTGDVRLREVEPGDLPIFFDQQRDPESNAMAAFPARDREAFDAHWKKILADDSVTTKTVLLDGRVAGNIMSFEQSGHPLVGYWIGREYWGRGVATRALSDFLDQIAARPLYARVAKHNVASIRVLKKCGFKASDERMVSEDDVEEVILEIGP